jgi:hypothetical protein
VCLSGLMRARDGLETSTQLLGMVTSSVQEMRGNRLAQGQPSAAAGGSGALNQVRMGRTRSSMSLLGLYHVLCIIQQH